MILIKNGLTKEVPTGFSWTSLLFGAFVPLTRGDMKGFFIQSILAVFTIGLAWLIIPFTYNKKYLNRCINDGWVVKDFNGI